MATAMGMVDKTHALVYQNAVFETEEFDVTVSIESTDLCGHCVQSSQVLRQYFTTWVSILVRRYLTRTRPRPRHRVWSSSRWVALLARALAQ